MNLTCQEINARLAEAIGERNSQPTPDVDETLLRRALNCPDATDDTLAWRLLETAAQATAAENRALTSNDPREAVKHWAAADESRRRAGIPAAFWKNAPRRKSL